MKHTTLLSVLLLFIGGELHSGNVLTPSSEAIEYSKNQIIRPSPLAANLGKYIDMPVGYSTGVPDITIPLYTIELNGYSLPITLSYHNSGIRVDQVASEVGLGWTLQLGGSLTRTIQGGPSLDNNSLSESTSRYESLDYNRQKEVVAHGLGNGMYVSMFEDGGLDREFYQFSIPEASGYYFYMGHLAYPIDKANRRLTIEGGGAGDGQTITSANNVIYEFGLPLKTKFLIGSTSYGSPIEVNEPTSWKLTEVITPKNELISYSYTQYNFTFNVPDNGAKTEGGDRFWGGGSASVSFIPSNGSRETKYEEAIISRIDFPDGHIEFTLENNERLDLPKAKLNETKCRAIQSMSVYNKSNRLIKQWRFIYSYYDSPDMPSSSDPFLYKRLMLDKVEEILTNSVYSFNYNHDYSMPKRYNCAQDFGGYYNGISNSHLFPKSQYSQYITNDYDYDSEYVSFPSLSIIGGADRSCNDRAKTLSLTKIVYPTKGSTEFIMEPNDGYGIRVKELIWRDTEGQILKKEQYEYRNEQVLDPLSRDCYMQIHCYGSNTQIRMKRLAVETYPSQQNSLQLLSQSLYNQSTKYLTEVIRKFVDSNNQQLKSESYIYQVFTPPIYSYGYQGGFIVPTNSYQTFEIEDFKSYSISNDSYLSAKGRYQWSTMFGGVCKLMEYTAYDKNGIEVKKELNEYNFISGQTYFGVKRDYLCQIGSVSGSSDKNYTGFLFTIYPIATGEVQLTGKTTVQDGVETTKHYTYDEETGNCVEVLTSESDGTSTKEIFIYPYDSYANTYLNNPGWIWREYSNGYEMLLAYKKVRNGKLVEGFINSYDSYDNLIKLHKATTQSDAVVFNVYEDLSNKYNSKSKLVETVERKGNIRETYLWSYNGEYPAIRVSGAGRETVRNLLTQQGISTSDVNGDMVLSEQNIERVSNALREASAQKAIDVTSYNYIPLVGVCKITDGRGISTTYNYDSGGRLISIVDHDGNKVSEYEYHFKQ